MSAEYDAYLAGRRAKPGYKDWRCEGCGGRRWVGWAAGVDMPRRAQCVPCGRVQELPAPSGEAAEPTPEAATDREGGGYAAQ